MNSNDIGKGNKSLGKRNSGNRKSKIRKVKIRKRQNWKLFLKENNFQKSFISGTSKSENNFYRNSKIKKHQNQEILKLGIVKIY